jgi:hypothetical protein
MSDQVDKGLLEDAAKLWLAHDGLWFLEVERQFGMEKAIEIDKNAWEKFTVIEAKRIKQRLSLPEHGGLEALKTALQHRMYAYINVQEIVEETPTSLIFRMNECRVQTAREKAGRDPFPCKQVGVVEYELFAATIDSRVKTQCVLCPPDPKHPQYWCAWKFSLPEPTD